MNAKQQTRLSELEIELGRIAQELAQIAREIDGPLFRLRGTRIWLDMVRDRSKLLLRRSELYEERRALTCQ